MPSTKQRISAICLSAAIMMGGAWLASQVPTVNAEAGHSNPNGLTVTVDDVRNGSGQVVVLIFNDRDAFKAYDYNKVVGYREVPASTGAIQAFFPDLKPGFYAVVAFHDENENRDLDMAEQVPTEGYAVSGARDAYDEPPFKRAASDKPHRALRLFYLKQKS
ncbi:MAG: DUF2141 domain-containing protein [Roseibium sp.]|uniref:DUF2141 domain-containing protein n=1 Tax=Roseibium sp. TaxID=1936156 RepID=UPI002633454A|nr:DUF2141 domain-containing protein [Roseibium sp.]MCV0424897.1 DUF2141 domain-containing protein [Roseibium sp.]